MPISFLVRRLAAIAALCVLLVAPGFAQTAAGTSQPGLPPLIDRELFFGNPEIAGAQISPDGQYISFIRPWKDTRNVWVKKAAEPFSAARLVTADTRRPIPAYFWSRDSKYILFVQDNAGDENYNVYAVDPVAAPAEGQDAPPARNLTDAKGARAIIYAVPRALPDVLYVGLNDRDAAWHDVYRVTISTGERTLVRQNTDRIAGWLFDRKGELRLATRLTDSGDTEILAVEGEGFRKVYGCSVLETCGPMRVHNDGKRFYAVTNAGDADLTRLALIDFATGKEELVESDPEKRVDISSPLFSDATNELLATRYEDERVRYYFRDKAFENDYKLLTGKLPGRDIGFASSTADEQRWIIGSNSDVEPGETFLFDRRTKALTRQYRIREKLPREHLAPMRAITYKSSDGLEIPAFLTLPRGVPAKNLPLVVVPHGGPWARDTWGYDSMAQFLANRGYAVLQPNFRASTGYGKAFLNAGNGEWGDKMQDDITWGVRHLVAEGIADAKRVGIMGGSYGGYATLAGVAFTPDVYAAGVSIVGPSNLITLLESIPPYWEAIRTVFHTRMGDPRTPEGRKQLERQSPLNGADKITTPLLVIQGANDPRVKKAESDQIVIALRERGFPVEYLVAPDEGHGFARPVNNMAMFAAAEKFLAAHLKARYQSDMPDAVGTRLEEITVDPKTVTLAPKVDTAGVGAPTPAATLQAGASEYAGTIEGGGQKMAFSTTLNVREEGDGWVLTERAKLPMGEAVDTTTLDKQTLVVRARSIKQGPVEIDLAFADDKATGTFSMGGQSKPVDTATGGPLFADGAGAHQVVATLPLAEGYKTTFRNFDVQRQKATVKQAAVTGIEEVTVPAGTFKAYKVEITSAEGEPGQSTVWVATEGRQVVKATATLPQMGGATLTVELQK
jgi:dipeptidyl aminopeptidase/acylaminoacyl peptidase